MPPEDPITELAAGPIQVHELFRAYVDAGFTEQQALYLVGCLLSVSMRQIEDE